MDFATKAFLITAGLVGLGLGGIALTRKPQSQAQSNALNDIVEVPHRPLTPAEIEKAKTWLDFARTRPGFSV